MDGKIGEYTFVLDSVLSRIEVFKAGDGSEPGWYIVVGRNIDEKAFHYEIMDWYAKTPESN